MNNRQRFSGKWETKRLGDISDVNPQNFSSNTNPDYKFNYITLEQVDSGKLLGYSEEVFRTAPSRAQRILRNGDVLMSTVRPNLMAHLFFHEQVANAVCSTGFAVLRAKHGLSVPYFLFSQLFSEGVNDQIDKILSGSNYPAINSRDVKLIEIPCPPQVSEQHAIAEVLSDVDGLLNALKALITKKRAIKQATMQQLLTGKTRLPGFSGTWETKRLGDVSDIDPENFTSDTIPEYKFNYISLEQVDSGKLLGYSQEIFQTAPSRARRILRSGDVLMSTVRPNLMAHLFFHDQIPNAVCSTGFAVLRAKRSLSDPYFLFTQLFSKGVNDQITKILTGSNYPAINSRDIKLIEISCPPQVSEQCAIASVLSDMDAEITALEQRRDKTRAIKQGMMQQLLTGRVRLVKSE